MGESLFGHLVYQFSYSPENLATEAFCFILNRSDTARTAFRNLLDHLNICLPDSMKYETQDGGKEDNSIPDLVGKDTDGKPVLYGESKFWAGLTENQPVTYLQRLNEQNGKLLVFFAPAKRFVTLWPEFLRRCNDADLQGEEIRSDIAEVKLRKFPDGRFLVLMSWRVVLNAIHQALEVDGDKEMVSDVHQLEGLCNHMDESAFLPLQSEELTSNVSQRIGQYCDLVDEVTDTLVNEGIASTKGYRATGSRGIYVRYMLINTKGCSLQFSPLFWNKYGSTPLWFSVASANSPTQWAYDTEARKALVSLEMGTPSRLFQEDNYLYVPMYLKTGVEKGEVVGSILKQIKDVLALLFPNG